MEYVILIIVIAVLALSTGGWLLFVRPRRGRVSAPPAPSSLPAKATPSQAEETAAEPGKPQATAAVIEVERPPPSAGRMVRLRARLARSQGSVGSALLNLLSRDRLDDETWDEIEEVLITADVGVVPARLMVDDLKTKVKVLGVRGPAEVKNLLRDELLYQLGDEDRTLRTAKHNGTPAVVLMVGVNGTGKTTTVGKLARALIGDGETVLLGAADTFRAAAAARPRLQRLWPGVSRPRRTPRRRVRTGWRWWSRAWAAARTERRCGRGGVGRTAASRQSRQPGRR